MSALYELQAQITKFNTFVADLTNTYMRLITCPPQRTEFANPQAFYQRAELHNRYVTQICDEMNAVAKLLRETTAVSYRLTHAMEFVEEEAKRQMISAHAGSAKEEEKS